MRIKPIVLTTLMMLGCSNYATASATCPDTNLLSGNLITDICWTCMFPIKAAGYTLSSAGGRVPASATNQPLCACTDELGVVSPGIVTAMWEPARVIELVRQPGCMAAMNAETGLGNPRDWGDTGDGGWEGNDGSSTAFYHYHYYSFPLLMMLELYLEKRCSKDAWADFDVMFMSEYDPIWRNEELAYMVYSESPMVANVLAMSACPADAISSTGGRPLDSLWWCAGSWGETYNLSGITGEIGSMPNNTSLLATRALATTHRRGYAYRTTGSDSLCEGVLSPMLPKSQYKMTMYWPIPETTSDHVIGQNTHLWGEWRNPPIVGGDDAIYLVWRWNDCCAVY